METFLIRALQLVMSLSLLVIIHEGGHFLFSKLFKVRVEKFYIFFDPWFSLFKFKPKHSETEYGVGWLPLGGYVKIAGMIDESMDTEQMKLPPQPWEFRSKPAWQRLIIMVAGVFFNFLLALFIYSMILFTWGDQYVSVSKAPLGMTFNETAKSIGFRDGDVLLSADGEKFIRYDGNMLSKIVDSREVTVKRDGKEVAVYIPDKLMQRLMTDKTRFATYRYPFVIDSIAPRSPAALAGMMHGDSIITLNGKPISFFDFKKAMSERERLAKTNHHTDSVNLHQITIAYVRKGQTHALTMNTNAAFQLGVIPVQDLTRLLPTVDHEFNFFELLLSGKNENA
jgi:regulator of sigma E protease